MDRKNFEKGAFRKRWGHDNRVIFLTEFLKRKSKMSGACFVSFGVAWTENAFSE